MDLLKEMTFKGKLVFVVIHQPSSEIYKLFDRLLLMDQGGFPIFDGNPIDAIVYFKHHIHHGNAEERECSLCGNVNPEQLFNIIDTKIVDEYGKLTDARKTTPEEWYSKYLKSRKITNIKQRNTAPEAHSSIPSRIKQFWVFFLRDVLSKLTNRQYILVTFLEAPLLALVLSFFVKYFSSNKSGESNYSFYNNENIPQYIFIAVVVALFLGLTVAAEEIHKDKKILRRESFLNLSKASYLYSKISILFIISAIQMLLFVLIGNYILEIKGLWFEYWAILFTTSCAANLLGLNISSAFNSAKVIYVIVPILIIPQLLFSGVIVKFDKLHPVFSKSTEVPWIGDLMVSRWSYEALAVTQSVQNDLDANFFEFNQKKYEASWKKDYWLPEIQLHIENVGSKNVNWNIRKNARDLLITEIQKEEAKWDNFKCVECVELLENLNNPKETINTYKIDEFFESLKKQYIKTTNDYTDSIERKKELIGLDKYALLKDQYSNEALQDIVTNRLEAEKIVNYKNELFRKDNPIYLAAKNPLFIDAHFYAPSKNLFGIQLSTFWANIVVLWLFVIGSFIALYFDWLRKLLMTVGYWKNRLQKKPLA